MTEREQSVQSVGRAGAGMGTRQHGWARGEKRAGHSAQIK